MNARSTLVRAVMIGLVGGAAAIFVSAIGMVEEFEGRRVITGVITLGIATIALISVLVGYRAAAPPRDSPELPGPVQALAAGAVAGLTAGLLLGAFVIVADSVDLRGVLINVTPDLLGTLAFGQTAVTGALLLGAASAAVGTASAALHLMPTRFRRPVISGLLAVLLTSLMEPLLRGMLLELNLTAVAGFLYEARGLTVPAAFFVFAVVTITSGVWMRNGQAAREALAGLPAPRRRQLQVASTVVLLAFLLLLPQLVGQFLSEVLVIVGLFVLLGLGLNIVVGYAGLLDLGYVAFFAVGAYMTALLTSPVSVLSAEMSFWAALPFVMIVAAVTGVLIGAPVLRLRGDYLAIVTLGFGEIVRVLFLSNWLTPWVGGAQGILSIPDPVLGGLGFPTRHPQSLYYPILAFCILAVIVSARLADSRIGRAWNAMREDEQVAEAMGVNTVNYKLLAFGIGAVFGCLSGAFFAVRIGSVFPQSFTLLISITVLALIILGGIGSIPGVIVGALVLVGLPELLREFAEYRLLIYGAVLVAMMLMRPEGLLPNVSRRRELHEEESDEEQFARMEVPRDAGAQAGAPVITGGAGT